ncbi:BrnT family toxin [Luteibacter anthropi]|uniref:BrnT family toxin n=1 Tax=Luteibacter anthropi TaxID=564369 RepID=UPI002032E033|nr:BrnT family toxin [Luteibacter anthropi]URX62527.1 BrnT family toxin [Luteibacter anthropi]
MDISYDAAKNTRNIVERELSFDRVAELDFDRALVFVDDRKAYGESRYIAIGELSGRIHVVVFTETATGIRVISFRKANRREVRRYENQQATDPA